MIISHFMPHKNKLEFIYIYILITEEEYSINCMFEMHVNVLLLLKRVPVAQW